MRQSQKIICLTCTLILICTSLCSAQSYRDQAYYHADELRDRLEYSGDADTFEELLEEAKQGDFRAQRKVGEEYEKRKNWEMALGWYANATLQGDPFAPEKMAEIYYVGKNTGWKGDYLQACIYYEVAADLQYKWAKLPKNGYWSAEHMREQIKKYLSYKDQYRCRLIANLRTNEIEENLGLPRNSILRDRHGNLLLRYE
jgi:TPR repeat protein